MYYLHDDWLPDPMRSDSEFLRKMGIKACVIDDPCPRPLPEEFICLCEMTHVRAKERLTKAGPQVAQGVRRGVGTGASGPVLPGFLRAPVAAPGRRRGGRARDLPF